MAWIGAIVSRVILLPLVGLICSHALLEVAHAFDWYPEKQLAAILIASPTIFQIEAVKWSLIAVLTALVWASAERFFYRRGLLPRRRADSKTIRTPLGGASGQPTTSRKVHLALKWIPSAGNEDIVAVFSIKANQISKEVAFIGRYAEAFHYLDRVDWQWQSSVRLCNFVQIFPAEHWEIEAIRRPRYKKNTVTIFDHFVLDVKADRLILVRLDVVSNGQTQHISEAFYVRPTIEGKVLDHVHLDHLSYIGGLDPAAAAPEPRTPILEIFGLAESVYDWDFTSNSSLEILDFIYGLRQAGADGAITFWGKTNRNSYENLTRDELLIRIPKDHWVDYELDFSRARAEGDNFYFWTLNKRALRDIKVGGFADVHVDRDAAVQWLRDTANRYKGHTIR